MNGIEPKADPATAPAARSIADRVRRLLRTLRAYVLGDDPTLASALTLVVLSAALFTRHPTKTNFIFDEQEALLANPYVRSIADAHSKLHWRDAFTRDFWGLPPDHSIGSYRPIPNLVWRALWGLGARVSPFPHHWVNVLLHGLNGALVVLIAFRITGRRGTAWLAGTFFVGAAIVTEAVSGVVGIADVLGGLGALLGLLALTLPLGWMPLAVFGATLFGMYSKESALCCVPLLPFAALVMADLTHPGAPRRWARAGLCAVATLGAFVFYVEMRRRCFPAPIATQISAAAMEGKPAIARAYAAVLRWYAQPALPRDPINNPLVDAPAPLRIAAGLRVYARGLFQVVFPWHLSGDYSAPQEPIPDRLIFPESVLGALLMIAPLVASAVLVWRVIRGRASATAGAIAVALAWIVVSYFPVSNIPIVLPTVRAERFWYFPVLATSFLLAIATTWIADRLHARAAGRTDDRRSVLLLGAGVVLYLGFQAACARRHANDYTDDLVFWNATRHAVPRSAKAHLNYSVMQGARQHMDERLAANRVALDLAPQWPMASVYLGDTLCHMHRADEAWPYYARGFDLAPNDASLIALGVQCLWEEHALDAQKPARDALGSLGEKYPASWLQFIARDTLANGETNGGVDPKYRPRGYNQGPRE